VGYLQHIALASRGVVNPEIGHMTTGKQCNELLKLDTRRYRSAVGSLLGYFWIFNIAHHYGLVAERDSCK